MPKYAKKKPHCVDHINEEYVQLLVNIKEILTKTTFSFGLQTFSPFYTTYTQHTDFIFGPNVVPQRYPDNKL